MARATPDGIAAAGTLSDIAASFAARGNRLALLAFRPGNATCVTYAELAAAIERMAAGLAQRRLGAGSRIALWAPNGPEWVIAYFAILRAGAAVVPLDHQAAAESVAPLLGHARPELLLTTAAHRAELRRHPDTDRIPTLLLDADAGTPDTWWQLSAETNSIPPPVQPHTLAALLYTSGTTGTPKGVPLTHGNLAMNAAALLAAGLVRPSDRVLLPLPLHHTYPLTVGLLNALGTGAAVIFPAGISGPELGRAAREGEATALLAVPRLCEAIWDGILAAVSSRGRRAKRAFFALLTASIAVRRWTGLSIGKRLFRDLHQQIGSGIRLIGCGGAKLNEELAWRLEGLGWTVLTGYGLTETSPVVTFNRRGQAALGSEGRPLPGVELRIDTAAAPNPGEIVVRGPSVFKGYWQNDAASAAAFTADGWFRTGDLGFLDERGFLHVVGRSKELLVLADGKKAVPEPLEKIYAASDLLREVAILEEGGSLVALIVPNEDALRRRGALREAALLREAVEDAAARLPPYQRVTAYRVLRAPLPRTQLGKLKRHLLPDLYRRAAEGEQPTAAAPTAEDSALLESAGARAVWNWLGSRFPGRPLTLDTSPQLDLAVDSLAWVALTLEIEQRFHAALDGDAVSRVLTLRDLLAEIDRARSSPAAIQPDTSVVFAPQGLLLGAVGAAIYALVRIVMRLAFRCEISGATYLHTAAALVIAPNHASYLDPLAVAAALPWRRLRRTYWAGWVGALFTGPLSRFVSRATRVLPIDPDRDLAGAIRTARDLVRQGYTIVWFPEGRRSPTGKLGPFLQGIGLLSQEGSVPVVPTALCGTFEAWPKQRRWPRLGGVIRVAFGEPIEVAASGARKADAAAIAARIEAAVGSMLGEVSRRTPQSGDNASSTPRGEAHAD